jgi:hypothetical protein
MDPYPQIVIIGKMMEVLFPSVESCPPHVECKVCAGAGENAAFIECDACYGTGMYFRYPPEWAVA